MPLSLPAVDSSWDYKYLQNSLDIITKKMNIEEDLKHPQEPKNTDPKRPKPKPQLAHPETSHTAPKKPKTETRHHKMSYTIVSGDTFFSIAQTHGTSVAAIEAVNPGVNPSALSIGQVINLPGAGGTFGGNGGSSGGSSVGGGYVAYSGPASNFPDPSTWANYDTLVRLPRLMIFLFKQIGSTETMSRYSRAPPARITLT